MKISIKEIQKLDNRVKVKDMNGKSYNFFFNEDAKKKEKANELKANAVIEAEVKEQENYPAVIQDFKIEKDTVIAYPNLMRTTSPDQRLRTLSNLFGTEHLWDANKTLEENADKIIRIYTVIVELAEKNKE